MTRSQEEHGRALVIIEQRNLPRSRVAGAAGLGAACGALVFYFFDPDRGRARRARTKDQAGHIARKLANSAGVVNRDLANRSRGALYGARYRLFGRKVDDQVLHERVRETLGRHVSHPHALEVEVHDGKVTLRGDVLAREQERTLHAIRRVPGVRDVEAGWSVHESPTGVSSLQGAAKWREPLPELFQQHWSPSARLLVGASGVGAWAGARRFPRLLRWPIRLWGMALVARATTNMQLRRLTGIGAGPYAVDVEEVISIAAPIDKVWRLVRSYERFPQFMENVREIRRPDENHSEWIVNGPAGLPIRFAAEEISREDNHEIVWQTVDGQRVAHKGSLRVEPENEQQTKVRVKLSYNPIVGALGHAAAAMAGADAARKLSDDLNRLKAFAESGRTTSETMMADTTRQ